MSMSNKLVIKIKKRSQAGWLMWLLIVVPFFFGTLNEVLGVPYGIRYVLDIAWLWLFILMGMSRRRKRKQGISTLVLWVMLFLLYTALTYVVQYQSLLYYLWGIRNVFRLFAAFFAFVTFLSPEDVTDYFKLFDAIFWINILASLFQYLFMDLRGDHLGGVFSTLTGGNGYTNIFFTIVLTKDILFYLEKRESILECACKCLAALLIAALAELKFFFVEFMVILALASLFTRFTWRKLWIILGGIAAVVAFAALLVVIFPNFEGFLSVDWFTEAGSTDKGYTSAGDLNRLNAIPRINEMWLTDFWQRLFGLGMGNCETSAFAFLQTPFNSAYNDTHYTWLSYAFLYLETGWIGLVFYYGYFVLVYLSAYRIEKRSSGMIQTYCRMGRILAVICMIITVYNSSLRTETAYMMFFALSVPFVMSKEKKGAYCLC